LGVLGIILGIALIKLRPRSGLISMFTGSVEIVAGVLFPFLNQVGLIVQLLAVLLETIIIYQTSKLVVADLNIKV